MRVVRRMSSRFLSQAMFDSIISNYTTVFLWVCPQNNLRTGLSMATASASDQTQAFVFAHFTKCAHHSNPSHKKFLLSQQLFHLSFNQKYNHKFRQRQKQNHQKKNRIFHSFSPFRYTSIFTTTFRLSIRRSCALKDIFSGFATRIIFAAAART